MSFKTHVSRRAFTTLLVTVTLLLAASSGWAGGKAEAGKPVEKTKAAPQATAPTTAPATQAPAPTTEPAAQATAPTTAPATQAPVPIAAPATPAGRQPFPSPDSHKGNWLQFHGSVAPLVWNEAGQQGNACLTCHVRSDCTNCHNTQPPRDHNNSWRLRTHGFEADADKERCETCHRQDMCVRCHNETPPRTHQVNWISQHCTWCHFGPVKATVPPELQCVVCHRTLSAAHP